jgi:hypothetical protein
MPVLKKIGQTSEASLWATLPQSALCSAALTAIFNRIDFLKFVANATFFTLKLPNYGSIFYNP